MVNFGLNSASILGIFLAVAGAGLYFLRSVRPELSRDHDIFFAAVGVLCGFILVFQGWRLDPILQFGQLLLTGSTIFFAVESLRLRGVATQQAKRNTQIVDDDREVSRTYQYQEAEIDDLESLEERYSRPRITGTRDNRRRSRDEYDDEPRRPSRDEYEDENRSQSYNRRSSTEKLGQGDKSRQQRRSRPVSRPQTRVETQEDEWSSPQRSEDNWDVSDTSVKKSSRPGANGSSRSDRNPNAPSRPKKRRPPEATVYRPQDEEAVPTDYVDYKPIDQPDDEQDNSSNFDEP